MNTELDAMSMLALMVRMFLLNFFNYDPICTCVDLSFLKAKRVLNIEIILNSRPVRFCQKMSFRAFEIKQESIRLLHPISFRFEAGFRFVSFRGFTQG